MFTINSRRLLPVTLCASLCSFLLFAETLPPELTVPEGDPLAALLNLILNFKAMSPLVIGSAVVTILVQSLKKFLPSGNVVRAVVTGLSVIWAVLQSLIGGLSILDASVMVFLTMGGAVAIYEFAIKPFLPASPKV